MSTPKHSLDERVAEKQKQLEEMLKKVKQQEAQLKQLEAKKKEQERKDRAHRLIQLGASFESSVGFEISEEELPILISVLNELEGSEHYFSKALGKNSEKTNNEINDFSLLSDSSS